MILLQSMCASIHSWGFCVHYLGSLEISAELFGINAMFKRENKKSRYRQLKRVTTAVTLDQHQPPQKISVTNLSFLIRLTKALTSSGV